MRIRLNYRQWRFIAHDFVMADEPYPGVVLDSEHNDFEVVKE